MEVNFVFHILLIIRFACLDKVEIREESLSENLLGFDILSFSYLELICHRIGKFGQPFVHELIGRNFDSQFLGSSYDIACQCFHFGAIAFLKITVHGGCGVARQRHARQSASGIGKVRFL